jgi:hypothetical protein
MLGVCDGLFRSAGQALPVGVCTLLPEHLSSFERFLELLDQFRAIVNEVSQKKQRIADSPEINTLTGEIIAEMSILRRKALLAGCAAGQSIDGMRSILKQCLTPCRHFRRWQLDQSLGTAFEQFSNQMHEAREEIGDIFALAQTYPVVEPKAKDRKTGPKVGRNDARDEWIHKQLCKTGKTMRSQQSILNELNQLAGQRDWEKLESVQALRQAAIRYAKRNDLDLPPNRLPS